MTNQGAGLRQAVYWDQGWAAEPWITVGINGSYTTVRNKELGRVADVYVDGRVAVQLIAGAPLMHKALAAAADYEEMEDYWDSALTSVFRETGQRLMNGENDPTDDKEETRAHRRLLADHPQFYELVERWDDEMREVLVEKHPRFGQPPTEILDQMAQLVDRLREQALVAVEVTMKGDDIK